MLRLLIAALVALTSVFTYCSSVDENPVTGEKQRVGLTYRQEVALGQRAVPELIQNYDGLLPNEVAQTRLDRIGSKLVNALPSELPYPFDFHLLAERDVINAFALPGGQICVTYAMLEQLDSEEQLAAILAHEIAHVAARHSAERIAQQKLAQGLTGATIIATHDPQNAEDQARMAALLNQLLSMKFSRSDELEADRLGVQILQDSGYDPEALIQVMDVLERTGGGSYPEFFSTHPSPQNRKEKIREAIRQADG